MKSPHFFFLITPRFRSFFFSFIAHDGPAEVCDLEVKFGGTGMTAGGGGKREQNKGKVRKSFVRNLHTASWRRWEGIG